MPVLCAIAWTSTISSLRMGRAPIRRRMKVRRVTSRSIEVVAPGKVNLILRVLDRRPDGYHNLWSVMHTFELADTVVVELNGKSGIRLTCEGADLPTDSANLAYRAAERVLARGRRRKGLRLHLRKRLPVAAGLGGGGSNAASTIQALAALLDTGWSRTEMAQLGQEVGSDVPFFFFGPTALVEGRGGRVTPLRFEAGRGVLFVVPGLARLTTTGVDGLAPGR